MNAKLITCIISALWSMESGKATHAPDGRQGEVGPLQIKAGFVDELNKLLPLKRKYYYDDRSDLFKSRLIVAEWLRARYPHSDERQVYAIALEYHCGRSGMVNPTKAQVKYAEKVVELVKTEMKE